MNKLLINLAFDGLSEDWKQLLVRNLKAELGAAIKSLNNYLATNNKSIEDITPPPKLMFEAFRLCEFDKLKVVLIGQDPYIKKGEAMGLSFSVPRGVTVPPSLRNIYKCLVRNGFMAEPLKHGDLTSWAKQGVLLLNCALTTNIGTSNAHKNIWADYTDAIIKSISKQCNGVVFVLFGAFAEQKASLVDKSRHTILTWGHPSPMNDVNKSDNVKNFIYCDSFTKVNEILTATNRTPINWNPDYSEVANVDAGPIVTGAVVDKMRQHIKFVSPDTVYLFTDGGAEANGMPNCRASWGYFAISNDVCDYDSGLVPLVDLPGEKFKTSNNRGELTGILKAVEFAKSKDFVGKKVVVVSDSHICCKTITTWYKNWVAKGKLDEHKNIDLIKQIYDIYVAIPNISMLHVNSHLKAPAESSAEWFYWCGNDIVDKLCERSLKK